MKHYLILLLLLLSSNCYSNILEGIVEVNVKNDTLAIVTTDSRLYYPFGKSNNSDSLHCLSQFDKEYASCEGNVLYCFTHKENSICFYQEQYSISPLEILEATIRDNSVSFFSLISVGMKSSELFRLLDVSDKKFTAVELVSGLDGVWITINTNGDAVSEIKIKTDYKFPKCK